VLTVPNAALRFRPSAEELAASGLPANAGVDTTRRARGAGGAGHAAGAGGATTATGGGAQVGGAAGAGQGGGAGGANRARRAGAGTGVGGPGTIWTIDANKKLKPVRVRIGLADSQRTQVTPVTGQALTEGTEVVIGTTTAGTTAATGASPNPLTPTRQGGGGPGGRGP